MMSRRVFILTGLSAIALSGCNPFATYTLRYRLKLVVSVDGKTSEGSSVIQVRWTDNGPLEGFDNVPKFSATAWGEAVSVEITGQEHLFGLLSPPNLMGGFIAQRVGEVLIPLLAPDMRTSDDIKEGTVFEHLKDLAGEFDIPERFWPVLVRFRDISDPKSAELVDPKNLSATYSIGTFLLRITISVTRDPVSTGIEKQLPWLRRAKGNLAGATGFPLQQTGGLSRRLTKSNFKIDGEML